MKRDTWVTLGGQWLKYVTQLVALIVFSWLLPPSDVGAVAIATSVVGLGYVISDFGLSLAAMQETTITRQQQTNLFWIAATTAIMFAIAVALLSHPLATFYNDARIADVLIALTLGFAASGLVVQHRAHLAVAGRYTYLAAVDSISQLLGVTLAIGLTIFAGIGVWGLVLNTVLPQVIASVAVVAGSSWQPGLPRRKEVPMRSLLTFGWHTFATQIVNYLSSNADSLIIGRVLGSNVTGYYNRAIQTSRLPIQQALSPLTRVMLPKMSRLRSEPEEFAELVQRIQTASAYLLVGMLSLLIAVAAPIVQLVLGPEWLPSAPLIQVLSIASAFQATGYVYYWVLLALARTSVLLWTELAGRVVMVTLMVSLAQFGAIWVAWSVVVGQGLILVSGMLFALPAAGLPRRLAVQSAYRPWLVAIVSSSLAFGVQATVGGLHPSLQILLGVFAWAFTFGAFMVFWPNCREDARSIATLFQRTQN